MMIPSETIKWYFPPNSGGDEEGFKHAGMTHFVVNPQKFVARETIQNVLDAKQKDPAVVVFRLFRAPPSEALPDLEYYKRTLEENVTANDGDTLAKKFFKRALQLVNKQNIEILQISDYNTVGITGINEIGGRWHNLIKKKGTSTPLGNRGGTFGIGKSAPFVCSELRTVLYNTVNNENETAIIWKSTFTTHGKSPQKRADGYFCRVVETNGGDIETLGLSEKYFENKPSFINRDSLGTDLYILGFNVPKNEGQPWQIILRDHVMDNYFATIYDNELRVKFVDDITNQELEINSTNILSTMRLAYERNQSNNYPFLDAYADLEYSRVFKEKIKGLGECKLYVKEHPDYLKSVAYIRMPKMLVYQQKNGNLDKAYAALLVCNNLTGNNQLAKMEGPTHSEWDPGFHPEKNKAVKLKTRLSKFVNESLRKLAVKTFSDQTVLEGLENVLGYEDSESDNKANEIDDKNESKDIDSFDLAQYETNWEDIQYKPPPKTTKKRKRVVKTAEGSAPGGGEGEGSGGPGENTGTGGTEKGSGGPGDIEGSDAGDRKIKKIANSQYSYKCYYNKDSSKNRLYLKTKMFTEFNIHLFARGLDTDKSEKIYIKDAFDITNDISLKISANVIEGVDVNTDVIEIDVTFKNNGKYSVEVELYG